MTENLLNNGGFEAGEGQWYSLSPDASGDCPNGWYAFWKLDPGKHRIYWNPNNETGFVPPEFKPIRDQAPYLNPPRGLWSTGRWAWCWFGFWKTLHAGLYQRVAVEPGTRLRFTAQAHAWSNMGDGAHAHDPKWSEGVGFGAQRFDADLNWPDLVFTGNPQQDARQNIVFQVGLDPLGGTDLEAASIVWSRPVCIYNVFDQLPDVEVTAANDHVTAYIRARSLWAFMHNDVYLDDATLEVVSVQPPVGRGAPRAQYARVYHVLPANTTPARLAEIRAQVPFTETMGGSYDDAGIGDLDHRQVVLWDIPDSQQTEYQDWYLKWYPGVEVEFRPKA